MPAAGGLKLGSLSVSVVWRARVEAWDWFEGAAGDSGYGFGQSLLRVTVGQNTRRVNWRIEAAQPTLLGLPDSAVAPAPLAQLGLGGTYYAANANHENDAGLFLKQAFVDVNKLGRGGALRAGRFEFFDGAEARIADPLVATIVQTRISSRLLSNFAFTVAQRSYDGAQFSWTAGPSQVTGFAARPTAGVFQVDGMRELDVGVFYGSFHRSVKTKSGAGSLRVFAIGYTDGRTAVLKTDNRPQAARAGDTESIATGTYGLHYAHAIKTKTAGTFDVLGWAVAQTGSWGTLSQRAGAWVGEAGWQPAVRLKPWLRGGYSYGSGDDNPADGRHGTFFQLLTTPRQYARFPFYNMMNNTDAYGMITLRPKPPLSIKSEVHALGLANAADLWYGGGGAFQRSTFGFNGRPSGGHTSLATVWDASVDAQVTPRLALGFYFAHASGHDVIDTVYPRSANGRLAFVESTLRF